MRDLEQLHERDSVESERRLGSIVMATVIFLGLSAAVGVVVGRAARSNDSPALGQDPLNELGTGAALKQQVKQVIPQAPQVEATSMSFPATLTGNEERPEVLAALAAAAQEEARLAGVPVDQIASPANSISHAPSNSSADAMPGAVSSLQEALRHPAPSDPLVTAASPQVQVDPAAMAPRGEEGEFSLHVMSYEDETEANAFVDALRGRGHSAFVAAADVPERGRYYRVRIGPFDSRWRAELYRKKFERAEQLSTIVVKRPDEP